MKNIILIIAALGISNFYGQYSGEALTIRELKEKIISNGVFDFNLSSDYGALLSAKQDYNYNHFKVITIYDSLSNKMQWINSGLINNDSLGNSVTKQILYSYSQFGKSSEGQYAVDVSNHANLPLHLLSDKYKVIDTLCSVGEPFGRKTVSLFGDANNFKFLHYSVKESGVSVVKRTDISVEDRDYDCGVNGEYIENDDSLVVKMTGGCFFYNPTVIFKNTLQEDVSSMYIGNVSCKTKNFEYEISFEFHGGSGVMSAVYNKLEINGENLLKGKRIKVLYGVDLFSKEKIYQKDPVSGKYIDQNELIKKDNNYSKLIKVN